MDQTRPYHHGDLRAALLRAAEEELTANGVEGFSLRAVAKRAGVSHAAPAHHFGDVRGLLTALCVEGFNRFLATQHAREAAAALDPRSQLVASGLGYVDFALANPALFRLMFSSNLPDHQRPDMIEHPLYEGLRNLPPAERDAALSGIIARSLPTG
jgi:AcrR family transcriptional regulator